MRTLRRDECIAQKAQLTSTEGNLQLVPGLPWLPGLWALLLFAGFIETPQVYKGYIRTTYGLWKAVGFGVPSGEPF